MQLLNSKTGYGANPLVASPLSIDEETAVVQISDIFLDTEVQDYTFNRIIEELSKTLLTMDQLDCLYRNDIAFLLSNNLNVTAGVWDEFDRDWMIEKINRRRDLRRRSRIVRAFDMMLIKSRPKVALKDWQRIRSGIERLRGNSTNTSSDPSI